MILPLFSWRYRLCSCIYGDGLDKQLGFNKNRKSRVRENTSFRGGTAEWPSGMFIFTGHRPMTDKLLNTDYELNPFNRSGAHPYMHADRRHSRITFFVFMGLKTCKSVNIPRSICFTITALYVTGCKTKRPQIWKYPVIANWTVSMMALPDSPN